MIRATLGFIAIVTAVILALQLPALLDGWGVTLAWLALLMGAAGTINITIAILDEDQ